MPPRPQLNQKTIQVMALLYHDPDGQHSATSISRTTAIGNGTLFPILDKLEDLHLITGEWEDANPNGRRRRRFYTLTPDGITHFETARAQLLTQLGGQPTHA